MKNQSLQIAPASIAKARGLRKLLAVALMILFIYWPLTLTVQAAPGDLDPGFGNGGSTITDFFDQRDELHAMALQSDQKVILIGVVQTSDDFTMTDFGMARYNTDGSLDATFGNGGKVVTDFSGSLDSASAIAIQPDGKIILAGGAFTPPGFSFALARYNTDGSLDQTFGVGGKAVTSVRLSSGASAVALQPDGKIIAAGSSDDLSMNLTNDFTIIRYNPDGSLDTTFGVGGVVLTDFFGISGRDFVNSLAVQPDGKIVAAGIAEETEEFFSFAFALARYDPAGNLDPSFGTGGKASVEFISDAMEQCEAITLQPDGKIVAVGQTATSNLSVVDNAMARFNVDGTLDLTFGTGGRVTTDFFNGFEGAFDVVLQPDGKIVTAGNSGGDIGVVRYNTNGGLDFTFGVNGEASPNLSPGAEDGRAVALQSDGKIVAAGIVSTSIISGADFLVARYEGGESEGFDICVQDDGNNNLFRFNSATGDYQFVTCDGGLVITGRGTVTQRGGLLTIQHSDGDRRILVKVDTGSNTGTASIQTLSPQMAFTVIDRNLRNNSCSCP